MICHHNVNNITANVVKLYPKLCFCYYTKQAEGIFHFISDHLAKVLLHYLDWKHVLQTMGIKGQKQAELYGGL